MGTLLIKLAGPLQSWGADSRFTIRKTGHAPTKSGIVGLLASALGRRRTESIDDLARLQMAVRIDQKGSCEADFETAHLRKFDRNAQRWVASSSLPLSRRQYLADAVFVVGVEVTDELLDQYATALEHPAFPLFLGRRSCAPAEKVLVGVEAGVEMMQALKQQPWAATDKRLLYRNRDNSTIKLEVLRDTLRSDTGMELTELVRDVPQSFSPENRQYTWRTVVYDDLVVANPHAVLAPKEHDPLALLEEVD